MSWSYRLARVAGIDVRIHATFLLLLALWGFQGYSIGGTQGAIDQVVFISFLFLCVLLHEFGHAFAARAYGIRTPDITLLPFGGVARLERSPDTPLQDFIVAAAGPAVNVVIGAFLWLLLGMPSIFPETSFSGPKELAYDLIYANAFLVVFNLIPAFPMDGGRMLRAILCMGLSPTTATIVAARIGQGIAILFVLASFGVFKIPGYSDFNPFLLVIAMFIFSAAQQEAEFAKVRASVAGLRVRDAMLARFRTFSADTPLSQAIAVAQMDEQHLYLITDAYHRFSGMVTRKDLLEAEGNAGTIESVSQPAPSISADASFDEAFRLMQQSESSVLAVVDHDQHVVGIVSWNLLRERIEKRA